ncbi:hypothetical protein BV22DRAFT_1198980 [Leucogyrophana mollusca]|uniref:Uncharacterized protein n=1 Tax=Leucogyrophana mollusca TaxID=85980 RepID=A0ACB8B4G4_9AGAM|nr:hypothetical protein BV22DRAFT_1198980 [Leucogyrophana mollusca]
MAYPAPRRRQPKPPSDVNRDSSLVRASVLETALELGVAHNSTVANWIFNNPLAEAPEEEPEPALEPESQRMTPTLALGSNSTSDESSSLNSPQTHTAVSMVQTPVVESPTMHHIHFEDLKPIELLSPGLAPFRKPRSDEYESDGAKSKRSDDSTWAKKLQPNRRPAEDPGYVSEGQYLAEGKALIQQAKEKSKPKSKSSPSSPKKPEKSHSQPSPNREGSADRGYVSDGGYMSTSSSKSKGSKTSKAMAFFRRKTKNKNAQQDSDDEDDRIPPVPPMPIPPVPSSPKPLRHHVATPSSPTRTGFHPLSLPFASGSQSTASKEKEKSKEAAAITPPRSSDTSSTPSISLSSPPPSKSTFKSRPPPSPSTPLSISTFPNTPLSASTFPTTPLSVSTFPATPLSTSSFPQHAPRSSPLPTSRHIPPPAPPPNQPLPQLPPSPSRPAPTRPIPALPTPSLNSALHRAPSPAAVRKESLNASPPRILPFPQRPTPVHAVTDPLMVPSPAHGRLNADGTVRRYKSSVAAESNPEQLCPPGYQYPGALRRQHSDLALAMRRSEEAEKAGEAEAVPEPDFMSRPSGARTTPPPYSQKQMSISHGLPSCPRPQRQGHALPRPPLIEAPRPTIRPSESNSKFHEHINSASSSTLSQILHTPLNPRRRPPSHDSESNRTHSSQPSSVSRQSSSEQSFGQPMRSSQSSYDQPSTQPSFYSSDLNSLRKLEQSCGQPNQSTFNHDSDPEDGEELGAEEGAEDDDDASFYPSDEKTAGRRTMYLVENGGESGDFDEDAFDFSLGVHASSR